MQGNSVTFKGTVNGLTIIMKDGIEFEDILKQIESKISSASKFFKDASLVVKYKGRKLSSQEEEQLLKFLMEKSGAQVQSIEEQSEEAGESQESNQSTHSKTRSRSSRKKGYFDDLEEGFAKIYRGTVRSGNSLKFDGNIVVIGDVNPGGEIIATGNVVIMGSLRGIVHAGADGNKDAVIAALNLQPTQLRIADLITRSPDDKNSKNQYVPEIAYVKDDMVYIERYLPQR